MQTLKITQQQEFPGLPMQEIQIKEVRATVGDIAGRKVFISHPFPWQWSVSEYATGYALGTGRTIHDAWDAASETLNKYTPYEVNAAIAEHPVLN